MTRLEQYRLEEKQLAWSGTFADYFEIVKQNPLVSQLSHARIYDMTDEAGVETDGTAERITRPSMRSCSASRSRSSSSSITSPRPPAPGGPQADPSADGTGRRRQVHDRGAAQAGAGEYSRTEDGAVYAIKGCPMHEDPLHLIPEELRAEIVREHGIYIEGDLCPSVPRRCSKTQYGGRARGRAVERIAFSEKSPRGHRHICADRPQEPGHLRADRQHRPLHGRRLRLGVRSRAPTASMASSTSPTAA